MKKKSLKKNYIYNLGYQILLLIAPIITTPYVSRVLGADGIGMVSYIESIAAYFVLFATFGISTYGQREISYVQDSIEKRSVVFWNAKILSMTFGIFVLVIYMIFAFLRGGSILYEIYSLNILAVLVDVTWFFQGMEEFGKIILRNFFFKGISIMYIFLFVRDKNDIHLYALGLTLSAFISNISLWFHIPSYIKIIDKTQIHPFKEFRVVLSLFVPTIAIQIYTVLDKTMIGLITQSSFENGYYEQSLKITRMVLSIVTALSAVMIPRIGYYYEQKNDAEVKNLMYHGYRIVWFLGTPLCFGLIAVSSNFVPWFYGEGFEKVALLLKILAFLILAIGINNMTGMQYLIPTKRQNTFTMTVIVGSCTNFIMNLMLIRCLGAIGAAISSVTAETVIAVLQLYIVKKELSTWEILKGGIHYLLGGIIMTVVLFAMGKVMSPSVINTLIMVVSGGVIYFGLLFFLKDDFMLSNIIFIVKKFRIK